VPTEYGDHLLQALTHAENPTSALSLLQQRFSNSMAWTPADAHRLALDLDRLTHSLQGLGHTAYKGRSRELTLDRLKECWFHLTDRCNLSCTHCLFASSPATTRTLPQAQLDMAAGQALDLGCRLFYFTGGEPFIYPDFFPWLASFLEQNRRTLYLS